ncbi:cardiac-enriched FHL2-interacting protein [Tamandua tetradactyla]|uniref:cardiac-enriched FHL2-interacting protein n=1 Tax=Tamandua tetradactyla TaxID=48850 RepID=UPI004053ABED
MQGNKKCADGFSDTSSIGSVLDEADREVSTLTDRAFRSLCISEDMSFNDPDLAASPDIAHQGPGSFHAHRKGGIWSQLPAQGTEHAGWAATVQQLPKYVQGEGRYPKGSPLLTPIQRKPEARAPGLRSGTKPVSKVSSLIKSFDRTESQRCDGRPITSKPPPLKNPPKFAPLPESGVNFCFDSAFLTVRRVPPEVSNPHPSSHQSGRKPGEQESPENPEVAGHRSGGFLPTPDKASSSFEPKCHPPPGRPAQAQPARGPEWVNKGTFLHSENSAFESWKVHQPRLLERKDAAETDPESKAARHQEDKPSLRETHPAAGNLSPGQTQASGCQEESRLAAAALSTSGPWEPRDAGAQAFGTEGHAPGSQADPQVKPIQPPWRKSKTSRRNEHLQEAAEEKRQIPQRAPALQRKQNPQGQLPEGNLLATPEGSKERCDPPFSISKLLTPVIPPQPVLDSPDSQVAELAPSPPGQPNGYQEKELSECHSRDSYKSKALGLLFNLKDVRRCVKSTYSPLPLSKGLDEITRGKAEDKQEMVSNGVALPNGLEESPPHEITEEKPAGAPPGSWAGIQKDPRGDSSSSPAGNHRTPSSPPAATAAPCIVNGNPTESNSYADNAEGFSGVSPPSSGWRPDSGRHCLRKRLSLQICGPEPASGKPAETLKASAGPQLENGFSRSVSQETEPGHKAGGLQNQSREQRVSPGPLSPEEEDVFYSDSQSDFTPSLKMKAKSSTSSSDQSFASFDDQQKPWFAESQREPRRMIVSAGDSHRDGKEKALGKDGFSDGHTCAEEKGGGERLPAAEGLCVGRQEKACAEEADFRGPGAGGHKDVTQDLPSLPSSTSNRLILFAIKDNTLRATPVIKPIMLPLLRTLSSEDSPGGGHKGEASPRLGDHVCPPESPERPCTPTPSHLLPASMQGAQLQRAAHGDMEGTARREPLQPATTGAFQSPPLVGNGGGAGAENNGQRWPTSERKPRGPRPIPTIALPEGDSEYQPGPGRAEQMQGCQSNFLSAPRAGPPGRKWVPGEMATSPDPSSPEESDACSPAASSIWDNAPQAPREPGWLPEEPPHASPWAGHDAAKFTRRELLTHALEGEAGDPQFEASAEDLRALSPGGPLSDMVTSSVGPPEKAGPHAQQERAAGKPPAVPPKTEKALRRAKKLASKRRKTAQVQERGGEPRAERPHLQDLGWTELGARSPREIPPSTLPVVRSLPPLVHRHSVSGFSEHIRRWPGGALSATPLPPYPATQKVLQDPQSGEYFVFDLPLQVKIKTFYDPDTGKYVKVSIPSSEGGSPEPPSQDELGEPCTLYPGFQPLPVTSLMPLRCSSQLSAPTFLRQGPPIPWAGGGHRSLCDTDAVQWAPGPYEDAAQNSASQPPDGPLHGPEEEGGDAPNLEIKSTNDLEDFATEGVS